MAKNKAVSPVAVVAEPVVLQPVQAAVAGQTNSVAVVEKLTPEDMNNLSMIKIKQELALSQAKTAVANVELAKSQYDLFIFQIAQRYRLSDGDSISDLGEITRL